MKKPFDSTDLLAINTIRTLSIDAIQKANSGHPGLPLGAAPFAYVLFQRHLKFNPKNPQFINRDRFVLSAGHGSALLYSLLHLYGYDLSLDEVKNFRQKGSKTPGHPEFGLTAGVEATTGPLGQGCANSVGMAIAERKLSNLLGQGIDHHTYALVGDGDLMEGISYEAASLAGHLKLGKLIWLYDSNDISLDGPLSLSFSENVKMRFESMGWNVLTVTQANTDLDGIDAALTEARGQSEKPTLIIFKTTIGFGSPSKAGTSSVHGSPLGPDELLKTKKSLGWESDEAFDIPADARARFHVAIENGNSFEQEWTARHASVLEKSKTLFQTPVSLESLIPAFPENSDMASREASGKVLQHLAKACPNLFGGDADLSCSTNTAIKDAESFDGVSGSGRNIHYGVREHAMGAIANGIAYHGGLRTYTATFFCFLDYMKPAVRLAAMNHLPVIFVFTHDSIGLGEDGPTHQPVEHLMSLRGIPGLTTYRPADANETRQAWIEALKNEKGPTCLVLSRQKLKALNSNTDQLKNGAYTVSEEIPAALKVTLFATGSEVQLALEVQKLLKEKLLGSRVVSVPCFEKALRDDLFKKCIAPNSLPVSIEAGITLGWKDAIGSNALTFGVQGYGESAPASQIFESKGLTAVQIFNQILKKI